jgi:hypothetical protein
VQDEPGPRSELTRSPRLGVHGLGGMWMSSIVPPPAGLVMSSVPPTASMPSRSPVSPDPLKGSAHPTPTVDNDRRPDGRADAHLVGSSPDRPRRAVAVVLDPCRAASLEDDRADVASAEQDLSADGKAVGCLAPSGDKSERAACPVVAHAHHIDRKQPSGLLDDRREHLVRRRPACHQSRDAPQRGLLLG